MKKTITIICILISVIGYSQQGSLVADTAHARHDTIFAKAILYWDFSKTPTTKIDSGYSVIKTAPMVFVGTNKTVARTDQETTIEEKVYILPSRKEIKLDDIISFRRRL